VSDEQLVKTIAKNCFTDGVEALGIIETLEAANGNGVSKALNDAKAGRAAAHIQRALFNRMHIIICRHYLPTHKDDLTANRAFELLRDAKTRAASVRDGSKLAAAEAQWKACNEDPGLDAYIHLRHKFLAHLAEPKPGVPIPMYKEVFDIARNTAKCFGLLANGTGIVGSDIELQIPAHKESAIAFWKPWVPLAEKKGTGPQHRTNPTKPFRVVRYAYSQNDTLAKREVLAEHLKTREEALAFIEAEVAKYAPGGIEKGEGRWWITHQNGRATWLLIDDPTL
jgi:AbiU2